MGLTKQYLRYVPVGNFNIIASASCNIIFITLDGQEGRFVAVGGCEHIIIWDLRLGEKAQVLPGEKAIVSYLCASPNKQHLAAGYSDGNIQVYDLKTTEIVSIFSGHKSEITFLVYDAFGHKLASGSKDTDIIVWDTISDSGLHRLSAHRGPITCITFLTDHDTIISSSKDGKIKFWDLGTQHCYRTLLGHRSEVWSMCLVKDEKYLITGCGDSELRVWKLGIRGIEQDNGNVVEKLAGMLELVGIDIEESGGDNNDYNGNGVQCVKVGSLLRAGRGRVVSMCTDVSGQVIACHGTDNTVELFHFLSDEQVQVRYKKRLSKARKKELKASTKMEEDSTTTVDAPLPPDPTFTQQQLTLRDLVRRLPAVSLPITTPARPRSLHLVLGSRGELRLCTVMSNNSVYLHQLKLHQGTVMSDIKDANTVACLRSLAGLHGHQSEVRSVAFSGDCLAVVSGAAEGVKLWNRATQVGLRSVNTGYVLSTIFVPGDRHILAGLKDGKLIIIDVAAGYIIEEIPAHTTELWSICLLPDQRGCVTGGGDNTVKFWQFELIVENDSETKAKVLSLVHTRTLKLEQPVLCVKISPNGKFIAAALLDSTVKIFFVDSFKFYLSLYGHKLPVVTMDISYDSTLIITGSADRNVKIWGMDFGDCHRSLFAHQDTVTCVQFVPRTHYFFTCGKDGKLREWDADNFNKIIELHGHVGECYNLSVSSNGQYVVTCGSDRVLRLYEKTDQVVVLEDEREEERAEAEEEMLATGDQATIAPSQPGLKLPSKKTVGSEKAAENILECLEVFQQYSEHLQEHAALQSDSRQVVPLPQLPLIMEAYKVTTLDDYLLEILRIIRASDLEEALLLLPFTTVCDLMQRLIPLSKRADCTELISKVVTFLLKIHHGPIVSNQALLSTLKILQKNITGKVAELRDMVAYNYYGLQYIQRDIESREGIQLFRDATLERKKGEKKRKRREKLKRSIMVLS